MSDSRKGHVCVLQVMFSVSMIADSILPKVGDEEYAIIAAPSINTKLYMHAILRKLIHPSLRIMFRETCTGGLIYVPAGHALCDRLH